MKILALEVENYPVNWSEIEPALLRSEAKRVYDLQHQDLIRQIHFRADTRSAVIEWEADTVETVSSLIADFPLVKSGLIHFDIFALIPYTGFNRLFG
jgi:hypothetical protein